MTAPAIAYDQLTDMELAAFAEAGHTPAIRLITTRNNQRMFRAAWGVLRHHDDAEDAVQQAYMKAFANITQYSGEASLSTWLIRIVINTALDQKRAIDRKRDAFAAQDVSILEDHRALRNTNEGNGASPEQQIVRAEIAKHMKAAIADLPDDFRLVFVLREIEGLSVRETAELANLAEATVKTRLFRARKLLRDRLSPALTDLFSDAIVFAGADCEAMTERVVTEINSTPKGNT